MATVELANFFLKRGAAAAEQPQGAPAQPMSARSPSKLCSSLDLALGWGRATCSAAACKLRAVLCCAVPAAQMLFLVDLLGALRAVAHMYTPLRVLNSPGLGQALGVLKRHQVW
jgi:hypothetical protein